jgi:hypothetical protein
LAYSPFGAAGFFVAGLLGFDAFCLAAAFFERTSALLAAAFFARAERCSGVMVSRERFPPIFPPILPPFFPALRKNSRTSGGSFFRGTSTAYTLFL